MQANQNRERAVGLAYASHEAIWTPLMIVDGISRVESPSEVISVVRFKGGGVIPKINASAVKTKSRSVVLDAPGAPKSEVSVNAIFIAVGSSTLSDGMIVLVEVSRMMTF